VRKTIVLVALVLVGCPKIIPSQPEKMTDSQLCSAYGNAKDKSYQKSKLPALKQEIQNRNLMPDEEWALADAREIRVGMSVCGLRASWGSAEERNYSSRYSQSTQHIYRLSWCRRCKVSYVYTENGKVTAIQN
jgi:hypothetical protein